MDSELTALLRQGRLDELEVRAGALVQRHPGHANAWRMLGVAHLARGRADLALAPLGRAASLAGDQATIWDNLGLAHAGLGDHIAAAACYERATHLSPELLSAWINWAASAQQAGAAARAETLARRALTLAPDDPAGLLNLGNALAALGRLAEAEAHYQRVLAARPGWREAELSLANLLELSGRERDSAEHLDALLRRFPDDWRAWINLGRVCSGLGETERAIESYRSALALNPQAHDARSGLLFLRLHQDGVDAATLFEEHRAYGQDLETTLRQTWRAHDNNPEPERRLRVGLVSGDLRRHSVAYFIEPILRDHARAELEWHVYANHPIEDEVTARLRRYCAGWTKVYGLDDARLAERVRADHIDILVDLSGHTAYNRLPVFARKPAPIQATWLGYPATTGLSAIDYRLLLSGAANPGELDAQFSEKLVYVEGESPFEYIETAPEPNPLPAMTRGHVTFAVFNRPSKLTDRNLAVWSRILAAVPGSRLLMAGIGDAVLEHRLVQGFGRHGVDPARLEMHGRRPLEDYLALHHEADILLDSFPYAGGTTTHHALWMGVPVVTLVGDTLARRVGRVILAKADLMDWVAESEADYVDLAVRRASDLDSLARLRQALRGRLRARRDTPDTLAATFGVALRMMWRRWCAGQSPASFEARANG
jgi:predicted O-linked N-acetylglucosamine transferase (SPINDLY family)